jgi:hypothetical protein
MTVLRIKRAFPILEWWCLLAFATAVYGPPLAVAQTPRLDEPGPVAQSVSDGREDLGPPTKPKTSDAVCGVHEFSHDTWGEVSHFGEGLKAVPRGQQSKYEWPAVLFWFFEFQIARSRNDDWTSQQWSDGCWLKIKLEEVESRLEGLVTEMKKAQIAPDIIKSARRVFRD